MGMACAFGVGAQFKQVCKRIGWINLCKCSKTRPDYLQRLYQEYRENCYSLFASKVVI